MIYRMVLGCSYDVSPPWGVISECLEQFRGSAHGHTSPLKSTLFFVFKEGIIKNHQNPEIHPFPLTLFPWTVLHDYLKLS